ncbi:sugar transporter [Candidatus Poribacteria bacterium]|nr:sugar transporter [Candidatus Poribacteria bacterium]
MNLIQFELPERGRRVGLINENEVVDLTSVNTVWTHIHQLFFEAHRNSKTIAEYVEEFSLENADTISYNELLVASPGNPNGWILPVLDHPSVGCCLVSGTGLTHLGSMEQRAQMHTDVVEKTEEQKTDSQKIFEMGLQGGKPSPNKRGVQPEWFYKGNGAILRGHNDFLDIPDFTEDGGEEPEIVGCYIIDDDGIPCRIGFTIGNEWADHRMERVNYLWLAPSKMRNCAIGPELVTEEKFQNIQGHCRITRGDEEIYHSGKLLTGENHMSHSLSNLEDHHFKYPHFRIPGDVHLHFFGTMKLSFPNRPSFQSEDEIEINFSGMGASLVNRVRQISPSITPIVVKKG